MEMATVRAESYVRAGVDALFFGDDIGMQHTIMMSEDLYYDGVGITFGVNPQYPEIECWCSINSSAENYG